MAAAPQIHQTPRSDFYVYVHRRATDGSVFYVGKGRGYRAGRTKDRSAHWRNIVAKHGFVAEVVKRGMAEVDAFALERELIATYGRQNLCNLTDGGEGMSGHVKSESAKLAVSRRHKGDKRPPEWRAAISAGLTGRRLSDESRAKTSAKLTGQKLCFETRAKMSAARKGRKLTAEHRAKLSQGWSDPETKARRGAAMSLAKAGRAILCVDTGTTFQQIKHALGWLRQSHPKASNSSLIRACIKPNSTAYGYRWRYA